MWGKSDFAFVSVQVRLSIGYSLPETSVRPRLVRAVFTFSLYSMAD